MELLLATTDSEIDACFDAFKTLRPHLNRSDFLARVRHQQSQGYQVLAVRAEDVIPAAAGFRFADFLAWGRVLYIDDLTTIPEFRGRGYGDAMMTWLIDRARASGCEGVHLDTGYARHAAHRLYLRKGLQLNCHHLALSLRADS
jgi:GNAT superfamily N-acetyltransferase